jgi:2-keto-3-deoxy-L-rhamnonate aldolase RhmA
VDKESGLKGKLSADRTTIGTQLRFGSPAIAELCSRAGFDFVVIDCEHAPQTPSGVLAQLQGIGCGQASSVVRLLLNDVESIKLYLDMGAGGVLVPNIETASQADMGARACRYAPSGTRGFGPSRAAAYGLTADYFHHPHLSVYLPIIESETAVNNIDSILAVEGVDSFILGWADLSISLGVPLQANHPRVQDAMRTVAAAAKKAGKPAGAALYQDILDPKSYQRNIELGFHLLLAGVDEVMMASSCRGVVQSFQQAVREK